MAIDNYSTKGPGGSILFAIPRFFMVLAFAILSKLLSAVIYVMPFILVIAGLIHWNIWVMGVAAIWFAIGYAIGRYRFFKRDSVEPPMEEISK